MQATCENITEKGLEVVRPRQLRREAVTVEDRYRMLARLDAKYASYALENANDWERVGTNAWFRKRIRRID